jgi:hypothetical protein
MAPATKAPGKRRGECRARIAVWATACAWLALWPGTSRAYETLARQLPKRADRTEWFTPGESFARVQDGLLLGHGREVVSRLPNRGLRLFREKVYRAVRHPDTGALLPLVPEWSVRSTLELTPALRLRYDHTRLEVHPPGGGAGGAPGAGRGGWSG